jgi:hypothetical protein
MAGVTNRGKYSLLNWAFRAATRPTNYYIALATSAAAPTADTNTQSELTQIGSGTGYTTNGQSLTPNATDFDVLTEDDANDRAFVQLKDITWTASGGPLGAARYAYLTDDNATAGDRIVVNWWDLSSDRTVSDGQSLVLQNCEIRIND